MAQKPVRFANITEIVYAYKVQSAWYDISEDGHGYLLISCRNSEKGKSDLVLRYIHQFENTAAAFEARTKLTHHLMEKKPLDSKVWEVVRPPVTMLSPEF